MDAKIRAEIEAEREDAIRQRDAAQQQAHEAQQLAQRAQAMHQEAAQKMLLANGAIQAYDGLLEKATAASG